MLCPIDNVEMKLIKAGISKKTGKPYTSFYKCDVCGETINAEQNIVKVNDIKPIPKKNDEFVEGKKENTKIMSRKDLMVALINRWEVNKPIDVNEMITIGDSLWGWIEK